MVTEVQNMLVNQWDALAPKALKIGGKTYNLKPKDTHLSGRNGLIFRYVARKAAGQYIPDHVAVRVTYDYGPDSYLVKATIVDGKTLEIKDAPEFDCYVDAFGDMGYHVPHALKSATLYQNFEPLSYR